MAVFTLNFTKNIAQSFINSIKNEDNVLYLCASKIDSWDDDELPPIGNLSEQQSSLEIRNDLLFGKRIVEDDISIMIARNTWTINEVYEMYDHRDANLFDKEFFVINSLNNVYKCLFNNNNKPSLIEPNFTTSESVKLSDGYIWKYMFTLATGRETKFATNKFIPVTANTSNITSAVDGSIDVVKVENPGNGYISLTGFVQDIISSNVLRIDNSAPNANNIYRNFGFYVKSGTSAGSLRVVDSYIANSIGKFVELNEPLTLDLTSEFLISPRVRITGDGSGATAYSIINDAASQLEEVRMVTTGSNYSFAQAEIIANTFFADGGVAVPIISPSGGHGSSPETELGGDKIAISAQFNGSEENRIPVRIEFRQFSILANPKSSSNNDIYNEPFFNQIVTFDNKLLGTVPFEEGEIIESENGDHIIKIVRPNVLSSEGLLLKGPIPDETLFTGKTSGVVAEISNVTAPDLNKYSGEFYYFDNATPLLREVTNSEAIKLILKF